MPNRKNCRNFKFGLPKKNPIEYCWTGILAPGLCQNLQVSILANEKSTKIIYRILI